MLMGVGVGLGLVRTPGREVGAPGTTRAKRRIRAPEGTERNGEREPRPGVDNRGGHQQDPFVPAFC